MALPRLALIYDDELRPETTGSYCLKALRQRAEVQHFRPRDAERIPRSGFDLYLNVDDGLRYRLPADLGPTAWWAIDTHLDLEWYLEKGVDFDVVFAAQKDGAEQLSRSGIPAQWLPLACDPAVHRRLRNPKQHDVCFVGRMTPERQEWLRGIREAFPNTFAGQCYFDEMAKAYSESRIIFNRSVRNDLNMRVFEALACGSLLVTNELDGNGQAELFESGKHLITYGNRDELLEQIRHFLTDATERERIAQAGRREVLARHTYDDRMHTILTACGLARPVLRSARSAATFDQIDFAIKTFLRPQALLRLLKSIHEFYPSAWVTIVDDGGLAEADDADSRACRELIVEHPRYRLHSLPFDSGVTAGRNALVERTVRPYFLLLDDDFCFTAETRVESLFQRLERDAALGAVAGTCIDVQGNQRVVRRSGGTLERHGDDLIHQTDAWRDVATGECDFIPHFALFRRELLEAVPWEGPIGGEHYDFCLSIQQAGWRVARDGEVLIDHYHDTPALPGYTERRFACDAAQQWLLKKWKLRRVVQNGNVIMEARPPEVPEKSVSSLPKKGAGYFEFTRPEVVALVPNTARRVLDIGCGAGALGAALKARGAPFVAGVERDSNAAARARNRLDDVFETDLDTAGIESVEGQFDCVICADVLEHLRAPERLLVQIRERLTPGGCLIASIPNVRHHSVVAGLLEGNWTYENAGLLDSDHVRFFTRREIEKLFYRAGFQIERLHSKLGPGDEGDNGNDLMIGRLQLGNLSAAQAEEFRTYQYLVVAVPRRAAAQVNEHARFVPQERINALRAVFPWPAQNPGLQPPTEHLGWLADGARAVLRQELSEHTKLVVELGSWLGKSTRYIADLAPNATVVAIDHWQGSPEHHKHSEWSRMLPQLYELFLSLSWSYRERIIPMRLSVQEGLRQLAKAGVEPDVIYFDAEHTFSAVTSDLELAHTLFPDAVFVGDDLDDPEVRAAVEQFAASRAWSVESHGTGWRGWRLVRAASTSSGPGGRELTSIILVTHNQLSYTHLCLESIVARTDGPYEIIVVDNGSTDGTLDYLRSRSDVRLVANPDNRGFPAAVNQGLRIASGQTLVLLNNDCVVTTGWLDRLLNALERDPGLGLVGPVSNYVSGPQQVPASYPNLESLDGFAWDWGKANAGRLVDVDRLVGFCLVFRRQVLETIGELDERFGIGCYEDDDYCRRALGAGFRCAIAIDAFVHHFGNRTFAGSGIDLNSILVANRAIYESKWNEDSQSEAAQTESSPAFETGRDADGELTLVRREPLISLCMIVRDNEHTIVPCLESIRPWVDEMIVVDTGSVDQTPHLARSLGAQVFEFPWCDDFSAARNESVRYARGKWVFWMDSDDTIPEACGRGMREIALGAPPPDVMGFVMQVHCPNTRPDSEAELTVVDHVKLFRNRPELRFEGRIHEQIIPAIRRLGGDVQWTDFYVVHSGSDQTFEGRERKLARDFRLLDLDLAERPNHPFVLFNLGMTYVDAERLTEGIEFLEQCLAVSDPGESHVRKAYALLIGAMAQADLHDRSWEVCRRALELYPDDKELLFRSGMLHHHFHRLAAAEAAYLRVLQEQTARHFTSVDCGVYGYKARHNLALVYEEEGKVGRALEEWATILEERPDYAPAGRAIGEIFLKGRRFDELKTHCDRLMTGPGRLRIEGQLLHAQLEAAQGGLPKAVSELMQLESRHPEVLEALQLRCRLLFEHELLPEALTALTTLASRAPRDASAFHNLGTVHLRLRDFGSAVLAFEKSLSIRPNSPATRAQLEFARAQQA